MMKKSIGIALLLLLASNAEAQKRHSGIFYSTLFAHEGEYLRAENLGLTSSDFFLADVDGDGRDDAVVYNREGSKAGTVQVALSDGVLFGQPQDYLTYFAKLSFSEVLMGDINGDGKADICFVHTELNRWEVSLAGTGEFPHPVTFDFDEEGSGAYAGFMLADVNGDGKADALYARKGNGGITWYAALSDGTGFTPAGSVARVREGLVFRSGDVNGDGKAEVVGIDPRSGDWFAYTSGSPMPQVFASGFGREDDRFFLYDIDGDGRDDAVIWRDLDFWTVAYSDGSRFDEPRGWIAGHKARVSKNNIPQPSHGLLGRINGRDASAAVTAFGSWWALENPDKNKVLSSAEYDTYEAWGNDYIPMYGCYDSGDPEVHRQQLQMIHDAGFTYIMLDITNGGHRWVDDRAKSLIRSIQNWNASLQPGQRKLYFAIAMGTSRQLEGDTAARHIEMESKRTWEEFYEPYKDAAYIEDGKPLLVHFVEFTRFRENFSRFRKENPKQAPYSDRFKIEWMFNFVKNDADHANAYGWEVGDPDGNPYGDLMAVMPGFYNGLFDPVNRDGGEYYRRQWLRVLKHNPKGIWLNSFNETWEHTSVEPARLKVDPFVAYGDLTGPWADLHGEPMDDFYWVMTGQYNRLYMFNELSAGSYLQEENDDRIYRVASSGLEVYNGIPHQAPVLLVPTGFIDGFKGKIR